MLPAWDDLAPGVRDGLTEQALGQQLITLAPPWKEPNLYYWQRGAGRPGKIDYLVQVDTRIVPVEARSGTAGSLKSLHQFLHDKDLDLAVRVGENPPSHRRLDLETTQGDPARYDLVALPPFLAWDLPAAVRKTEP